ncbi:MAG: hypothetical protein ACXWF8_04935 [Methylobacter sp.]
MLIHNPHQLFETAAILLRKLVLGIPAQAMANIARQIFTVYALVGKLQPEPPAKQSSLSLLQ